MFAGSENQRPRRLDAFLGDWFGCVGGRDVAAPYQTYLDDSSAFAEFCRRAEVEGKPLWMSVQPRRAHDVVYGVERLFYDFDADLQKGQTLEDAWTDVLRFSHHLKDRHGVNPLLLFSGKKGYHLYLFFLTVGSFEPRHTEMVNQAYRRLMLKLMHDSGDKYPTFDIQVLDIKRLSRVPYFRHQATGNLCIPVDENRKPIVLKSLDQYRKLPISLLGEELKKVKVDLTVEKALNTFRYGVRRWTQTPHASGVRPCIARAVESDLSHSHLMRLGIAVEYLTAGWSVDAVTRLFEKQRELSHYDEKKTRYYVEHALKRGYRRFRPETVQRLGFCLGSTCALCSQCFKPRVKGGS